MRAWCVVPEKILVTGVPKSGTNAAKRAVELLGKNALHRHTTDFEIAKYEPVIVIFRNPRNVLVSAVRYHNKQVRGASLEVTEEKLLHETENFFGQRIVDKYWAYLCWLDTPAFILRYEKLVESPEEMKDLAAYLDVPYNGTYKDLPGHTGTWTGKPSVWQEHWTKDLDKLWRDMGMLEVEKELGYLNDR